MPTNDGFDQEHTLPLFLSDEPEQQDIGQAWNRAVISSRVLKATILVATATAIGIALLSVGNPVTLFPEVLASRVNTSALQPDNDQPRPTIQPSAAAQALPPSAKDVVKSALQPGADQSMPTLQSTAETEPLPPNPKDVEKSALQPGPDRSMPTIRSTADAKALPANAKDARTRDEIATAFESADQSQTQNSELSSESLFRLFQAWADEKDAQAQVGPIQSVAENVHGRASLQPKQNHGHVGPSHTARAEIRHVQNPGKKPRQEQNARVQVPPPHEGGAQDSSAQNPQASSLLQTFGLRN